MKKLLYLVVFSIICVSVSASDISILTYRDDYRPLETFQAEIIFDEEPLNELTNLNFELYKEGSVGIILNLEKLNNKRYFVYFNIPDVSGEHKFRVKNINIVSGGILRRISEEKTINIMKINSGFEYLSNQNSGDITEIALSALALKNIGGYINYLLNNQDPTGCYPKGECNIKDTSFALLALDEYGKNYIKTKNWLKDASNNFDLGVWKLKLEGTSTCGEIELNGAYELNIEGNEISLSCDSEIDFTLIHSYLGNSYTIYKYTGDELNYIIEDSGCYGLNYKTDCNYLSSLYASWALKEINENFPRAYLEDNKLDNRTIDHALGYILYGNNYDKDWLLNNYLDDYWSYYSASLSQEPDYFVSALATYALRNEFLFDDAKEYLRDKTEENILSSALILYLLFDDERNLPSVSISPGIVNKKNIFNLRITNNEEPITVLIEAPNFTNLPTSIYLEDEVDYNINVDESFDIIITYGNYSYTIPVISEDEEISDSPLLPPPKDAIQFVNEDVEINLDVEDSLTDELSFINNWNFKLIDVKLNITGRLKEILKFEQDYFSVVESNETLSTEIYLNQDENPIYSLYEGYLVITSAEGTLDSIKLSIIFEQGITPPSAEDETTEEELVEGEETEDSEGESKPVKKKKNLWWVWLIMILIIGTVMFIFFRGKKELTQSFGDYAKKIKK